MDNIDFPTIFKNIEENNLAHGVFFLTYLIGSKYVFKTMPKTIKSFFENFLIRIFVIFSATFVATKNTKNALILAVIYIAIVEFLLNPKSKLCMSGCIVPKKEYNTDPMINNQTVIQQQQPGPQQQQVQTQLQPLQPLEMDMNVPLDQGPMAFGVENFSNY